MPNGKVSLGYLRLQAKQRADLENNPAVSDSEWNGYLSASYKELYDKLVGAYGNDYYMALPYQFALTGEQFYPLPDGSDDFVDQDDSIAPAFYKLLGVDLQYSGSPTGWVSLKRFEFLERNKYAYPNNAVNLNGYTNLKYRLANNDLWLIPIPATSQAARIWYIPEPTNLQFAPTCDADAGDTVVAVSSALGIEVGMKVYTEVGVQANTVVSAVDTALNTVTLSKALTSDLYVSTVLFWTDAVEIDGISGWEEYVIIDAAIKAAIKQENPITELAAQLEKMGKRIDSMAEGRDAGQAAHTTDALSINGWGDTGDDLGGGGSNGGWGG